MPPSQGLVGYVYTTGQALALSDVERDARFGRAFAGQTGYVPRSIVAVPLVDEHGTIGVLEVLDKRDEVAFSLRDIELASVFARQAAVAISASRVERDVASLLATVTALAGPASDGRRPTDRPARRSWTRSSPPRRPASRARRARGCGRSSSRSPASGGPIPAQLELVADLLSVLADHAERAARGRSRRR